MRDNCLTAHAPTLLLPPILLLLPSTSIPHSFSSVCPACQFKHPEISRRSFGASSSLFSSFPSVVSCCGHSRHIWEAPIKITGLQVLQCVYVHVKAGTHRKSSPTNLNYIKVQRHVSTDASVTMFLTFSPSG